MSKQEFTYMINCPNCDDNCGYTVEAEEHPIYETDEEGNTVLVHVEVVYKQVQCEFCWTNPKSVSYNVEELGKNENR